MAGLLLELVQSASTASQCVQFISNTGIILDVLINMSSFAEFLKPRIYRRDVTKRVLEYRLCAVSLRSPPSG